MGYPRYSPKKKRKDGYRSGLEKSVGDALKLALKKLKGVTYGYETEKLAYTIPASLHQYNPDWVIRRADGSVLYVETKGRFTTEDRKKMVLVTQQHPKLDIRMLFSKDQPLYKGSKTMYSDWCKKNGIKYGFEREIPLEWLKS